MEIKLRPKGFFRVDKQERTLQFTRLTFTTLPQIPHNLRNFDRLNRKQRSSVYRLGEQNPMQMRDELLFVRGAQLTNTKICKAEYFKFLSSMISNGIRFRIYPKGDLVALICYEESPVFSYENVDSRKLILAMEEMEYKVNVFNDIPGIEKGKGIRFEGDIFRSNLNSKLMQHFNGQALKSVLKQIYRQLAKNRFDKEDYNNKGGLNFTVKGEEFRLAEPTRIVPTRQVIQGDQGDIHTWLNRHLVDHSYDRMLVVGGLKPDGFTELDTDEYRTDFIRLIRENLDDKEVWLGVFQVMEKVYLQNNLTTNMVDVLNNYFTHLNDEMKDVIDIYSFIGEIPDRSDLDYITIALCAVFDRYSHLSLMGKGEGELPEKIYLPMDGNMQDISTTIALMMMSAAENAEFITFVMINDSNLSDFMASAELAKVFERIFGEMTVIYHSNNLQQNLFLKMDKLILKHNNTSRDYVRTVYGDPLLLVDPVFISRDDDIIWIDRQESPVLAGHQLLFEFHPDYDRIFNSNIDNFEEMIREVVRPQEEPKEVEDEGFYRRMNEEKPEEEDDPEPAENPVDESGDELKNEDVMDEPEEQDYVKVDISSDVKDMADDYEKESGEDLNFVMEVFKRDFGFKAYLDGIGGAKVDPTQQIENLETHEKFARVILQIKESYSDQLALSKFDPELHQVIDQMVDANLLRRERIDEATTHILLTKKSREDYDKTIMTVKELRSNIRERQDIYFKNIDQISDANRGKGSHTITKTVISMAQLLSAVYLDYFKLLPPVLLATHTFWKGQIMKDPEVFAEYLDSKFLQSLQSIRKKIVERQERPEEEVIISEIPTPPTDTKDEEVVDKISDVMQPIVLDKSFNSPTKKSPDKVIPEGVTDIGEQLKGIPVDKKPRKKRPPTPKKEAKPILTIAEVRDKIIPRELISDLLESENRVCQGKILMSEEDRDMREIIPNLSLLDFKLAGKPKRILLSSDVQFIDQLLEFDPNKMEGSTKTMIGQVSDLKKQIKDRIERNADFQDILLKSKLDFLVSLGAKVEKEHLSRHVVYKLSDDVKGVIKDSIEISSTKEELLDNVYTCFMELMGSVNRDLVDNLLRQMQRRNNPILFDGEFSDFSINWLYTITRQDRSLDEIKTDLLDKVDRMYVNNNMAEHIKIRENTDEESPNGESQSSE